MNKIIKIEEDRIIIGLSDKSVDIVLKNQLDFEPELGMYIDIYSDGVNKYYVIADTIDFLERKEHESIDKQIEADTLEEVREDICSEDLLDKEELKESMIDTKANTSRKIPVTKRLNLKTKHKVIIGVVLVCILLVIFIPSKRKRSYKVAKELIEDRYVVEEISNYSKSTVMQKKEFYEVQGIVKLAKDGYLGTYKFTCQIYDFHNDSNSHRNSHWGNGNSCSFK